MKKSPAAEAITPIRTDSAILAVIELQAKISEWKAELEGSEVG